MRQLTVRREKTFVGSAAKAHVYIADPQGDTVISGMNCSKLGELRNNEEKTFEITEEATRDNPGLTFSIALNYGGRDEIIRAVRKLLTDDALRKRIEEEGVESVVDEALIASSLDTAGLPDPDLLIRTSGEERTSNFLPWQLCYTEFYFTDTLWPDFDEAELNKAIDEYGQRSRRYGA